ncbi:MAG TPA: Rnf-Nqr domain containing protein [Povalibacter sp.]|uniref:Rnf-Nqr domain containing protein n=1 Tax=Povalibacter sp. TaxID=1962978 RepID=UPI002C0B6603|nr:Rnf-Nqr domain containing protein [Povalibacter sp.]HMN43484.1 Rnf-Nqr domain containing protein [Povalibacter sp.]
MNTTSRPSSIWLLIALCPALATSDLATNAIALGVSAIIACFIGTTAGWLTRTIASPLHHVLTTLVLAALVSLLGLWMSAAAHELRGSLGVFLPLLSVNFAIVALADRSRQTGLISAWRSALIYGVFIAAILIVLGLARELVGRGSLFHDAADALGPRAAGLDLQLFPADMGFLLAMLPPGAFIAFGVLLAARNWLRHRHEPSP